MADPETGTRVEYRPADLKRISAEYADVLILLSDLERGMIHLTLAEYETLPAPLVAARRVFLNTLSELRKDNKDAKR